MTEVGLRAKVSFAKDASSPVPMCSLHWVHATGHTCRHAQSSGPQRRPASAQGKSSCYNVRPYLSMCSTSCLPARFDFLCRLCLAPFASWCCRLRCCSCSGRGSSGEGEKSPGGSAGARPKTSRQWPSLPDTRNTASVLTHVVLVVVIVAVVALLLALILVFSCFLWPMCI